MEKIDKLIDKFKDRTITHPELATMWIHYLTLKRDKYLEIEKVCLFYDFFMNFL